jgi:AraC-like DNA-binding protein
MEPRITHRPGVGTTATILQQQELEFKRLYIDQPVLIVVERGVKSLRWDMGEYIIRSGEGIAIAGGQSVDITNRLAEDDSYRAHWLVWDDALIAAYAEQHTQQSVIRRALPICVPPPGFAEAFLRAIQGVEDATMPEVISQHRASEMLLWIGMHGGRFEQTEVVAFAVKVRRLIGQDLAREWSSAGVASAFAMSEATLRRRLADEHTSLSEVITDSRLSFALNLLQSTAQPVTQIALNVGYQSPSNFAARFRERFGFPPSAIRGHRRLSAEDVTLPH